MSWNLEQAVNDLERYVLRGELPAADACKVLIENARAERTCTMETDSNYFNAEVVVWFCSECGSPIYNDMKPSYCLYCGAKVVE